MFIALMSTGFTIGILYLLFVAPYLLAKGMFTIQYGECYGSDKLKCAVPIYNLYIAEKLFRDKFPIISTSSAVTLVLFIVRMYMMIFAPENILVTMVVLVLFLVSLLVFWIASSVIVYQLIDTTESIYGFRKIMYVVLFPLGEFYIGNYLATTIRNEADAREAI